MDQDASLSAYQVVNEYSYHELVKNFLPLWRGEILQTDRTFD